MSQTPKDQADPKLWRPFLRLAKYLTDDFLSSAEEWLFLVSSYGIEKVRTRPTSKEELLAFVAHCHDGWKQAQTQIAGFLTDALARRTEAQMNENEQHRLKNKEAQKQARAKVKQISLEIAVARRMLDVILWTIFAGDHSTLRRLIVDGGEHSLSTGNISVALHAADYFNKDPQVMALSTDMLSLVHVGDLILANSKNRTIEFVELKAGDKNLDIATIAEFAVRTECEVFEARATAEYDEADKKHYKRVKKQTARNAMIISTIRNEGGTDPNTGNQVVIRATPGPVEYWTERITRCYESLTKEKIWATDVIDSCVYLGVYSDQYIAFVGFQAWMDQVGCDSPIFSLTDSFHDPGVRPLGATLLSTDLKQKLLRGEILVIMCLDILKFIELANKMHPDYMRLATKSETTMMRQHRTGNFMLKGRFICATIGDEVMFMGAGTRDRILFDQQVPSQLLEQRLAAGPISQNIKQKGNESGT